MQTLRQILWDGIMFNEENSRVTEPGLKSSCGNYFITAPLFMKTGVVKC